MDQRITLKSNETFDSLLQQLFSQNERVRILYDDEGIERAEGLITQIELEGGDPYIILNSVKKIIIQSLIGVNGIFKDDYTEC